MPSADDSQPTTDNGLFPNFKNNYTMSRKKNKNSLSTFVNTILTIFGENPFKPMNYKQIAKIMSVASPPVTPAMTSRPPEVKSASWVSSTMRL